MSHRLTNLCRPLQLPPTAKAVLMALADYADDSGACWPSIASVCEWTCYSERAVRNAIRDLERAGHVTTMASAGRTSNRYTLTPNPAAAAPFNPASDDQPGRKCRDANPASGASNPAPGDINPASDDANPAAGAPEPPRTTKNPQQAPTTGGGFEPTQDKPLAVLLDEARANMTPAGIAAVALRRVGVAVNSTNPDLVAALNDGVAAFELVDLAETHPGKPIRYLTQIARRQKAEGAAPVPIGRGPPPRTLSKTAEAFLTLEGMKSENRLAARRDFEGPAEAAGLIAGPDAGE
jgi:hypothetical protein